MKVPTKKSKKKAPPARIFSGEASRGMWEEINSVETIKDVLVALYTVCCKLQEFEVKMEKEGKNGNQ